MPRLRPGRLPNVMVGTAQTRQAERGSELGGVRTFLAVPMLKENELIGAFIPTRFHASRIRFTQNSSGQSKMSIDSNHGIYREHFERAQATSACPPIVLQNDFESRSEENFF
jgi:hypothetical protein